MQTSVSFKASVAAPRSARAQRRSVQVQAVLPRDLAKGVASAALAATLILVSGVEWMGSGCRGNGAPGGAAATAVAAGAAAGGRAGACFERCRAGGSWTFTHA